MTTRGVRRRLDFDRDVADDVILDCIDVAEQAPTGGNNGSRRWIVIRDQDTKDHMAELYLSAGVDWVMQAADRLKGTGHQNEALMQGAKHLGENIARSPALVIPTVMGRHDGSGRPGLFDSVIQSAWSFMVALRARAHVTARSNDGRMSSQRAIARTQRQRTAGKKMGPAKCTIKRPLLAVSTYRYARLGATA